MQFLRSFRVRLKHIVRTTGWDILQLAGKFVRVLGINPWYVTHEPPPTFGLRSTSPQGMGSAPDLFHGVNGTLAELAYWKLLGTKRLLLQKQQKPFARPCYPSFDVRLQNPVYVYLQVADFRRWEGPDVCSTEVDKVVAT